MQAYASLATDTQIADAVAAATEFTALVWVSCGCDFLHKGAFEGGEVLAGCDECDALDVRVTEFMNFPVVDIDIVAD